MVKVWSSGEGSRWEAWRFGSLPHQGLIVDEAIKERRGLKTESWGLPALKSQGDVVKRAKRSLKKKKLTRRV